VVPQYSFAAPYGIGERETIAYSLFPTLKNAILLACVFATESLPQNVPAFRSNVEIVVVPFTVVDANGVAVEGLTRDDFHVYDDDVRRPIENLWIDHDLPLTLGVIIDASESQKEQLSEHRQTAIELFQRILRPGDRTFVISADENIRLWVDLTAATADARKQMAGSPGELFGEPCPKQENSVAGLRPMSTCGSSPLWDAIYDAARLKLRSVNGNKALVILTDGFDSGSTHSWRQAADAADQADASVYAIQYRSAFGRNYAPDLYRLVTEAGGTWFGTPGGEYGPIVSRIETDLRHRYVLGFRPERLSGKVRHNIRIEVTRPDLTVRARETYFQEPQ
jgi:Ca-activated chloride channel family protein